MTGTVRVGTSGFAYPKWAPRFYPAGLRGDALLRHYASRLSACELNNTYYQSPTPAKVAAWLEATPPDFRFAVKAQRGGSYRSLLVDPVASVPWLTDPLREFGERLGTVLFRVPDNVRRDDDRLAAFLAAWPPDMPLTVEFQDPTWHVDEVFARLREAGAAVCTTELPEDQPSRPRSAAPAPSSTSGSAATTTARRNWPLGQRGSSHSSRMASTLSCSSATTTWAGARNSPSSSPALTRG